MTFFPFYVPSVPSLGPIGVLDVSLWLFKKINRASTHWLPSRLQTSAAPKGPWPSSMKETARKSTLKLGQTTETP